MMIQMMIMMIMMIINIGRYVEEVRKLAWMSSQPWHYCLQEHILGGGHGEIWRASSRREGIN
jgi:hypothetical protein